jgi:hypothetical protein
MVISEWKSALGFRERFNLFITLPQTKHCLGNSTAPSTDTPINRHNQVPH